MSIKQSVDKKQSAVKKESAVKKKSAIKKESAMKKEFAIRNQIFSNHKNARKINQKRSFRQYKEVDL
jgi:predicted GIY-YIG superfamily endonuclease